MKTGRRITGSKYKKARKKKLYEMPGQARIVKFGGERRKHLSIRSGIKKVVLFKASVINVVTKDGKAKKAEIKNVIETPSNKFLARQNILTKGTIVETELGKVRITNRPSQEGMVNGIVVE